jgi:hypothetical protein
MTLHLGIALSLLPRFCTWLSIEASAAFQIDVVFQIVSDHQHINPLPSPIPLLLTTSHTLPNLPIIQQNARRYSHGVLQIRPGEHSSRATTTAQTRLDSTHRADPLPIQAHLRLAAGLRHLRPTVRQHDDLRRRHGHADADGNAVQRPQCRQHDCLGGDFGFHRWSHWPGYHGLS